MHPLPVRDSKQSQEAYKYNTIYHFLVERLKNHNENGTWFESQTREERAQTGPKLIHYLKKRKWMPLVFFLTCFMKSNHFNEYRKLHIVKRFAVLKVISLIILWLLLLPNLSVIFEQILTFECARMDGTWNEMSV